MKAKEACERLRDLGVERHQKLGRLDVRAIVSLFKDELTARQQLRSHGGSKYPTATVKESVAREMAVWCRCVLREWNCTEIVSQRIIRQFWKEVTETDANVNI